jgi:hypothetical protein
MNQEISNIEIWTHGLVAAAIGGAASAIAAFTFSSNINWHQLEIQAGVGALLAAVAYLKQSPLPPLNSTTGNSK